MKGSKPLLYNPKPRLLPNFLHLETIAVLLHGGAASAHPPKRARSSAGAWPGAALLIGDSRFSGKEDVVERSRGRLDFSLSDALYKRLVSAGERAKMEEEIATTARLASYSGRLHHSFHVMVVEPGAVDQAWHYDNDSAVFFLTMLLPLTEPTPDCGRTEFFEETAPLVGVVGSSIVFDGKQLHRGTANLSQKRRIFAYLVATSESDANDGGMAGLTEHRIRFVNQTKVTDTITAQVGQWYNFQGDQVGELWPAKVHGIFWENGRKGGATMSVQWLYKKSQCDVEGWQELYEDPKERLFSLHFDEVQVSSCMGKCVVCFAPSKSREYDYIVRKFFDHIDKVVVPFERSMMNAEPVVEKASLSLFEPKEKRRYRGRGAGENVVGNASLSSPKTKKKRGRGRPRRASNSDIEEEQQDEEVEMVIELSPF